MPRLYQDLVEDDTKTRLPFCELMLSEFNPPFKKIKLFILTIPILNYQVITIDIIVLIGTGKTNICY